MIKWREMSFAEIQDQWRTFILSRQKGKKENHITCIEREALIDELLARVEGADPVIKGYKYFLETMKQEKKMDKAIKSEKKVIDKGMDKLVKMDKKNDKKHEKIGAKKAMKKKGC